MQGKSKIKLIKLSDEFEDNSRKFPYVHTTLSNIRFRLRSKITYDHEPVLLIEKLNSFEYILPMKHHFDLESQACQQNFIVLKGQFDEDGSWYTDLKDKVPGVVSFQVAFAPRGSTTATRYGTCDVVFLTQATKELRRLRKQSVFPRCIGNHQEWVNYFLRQHELGYNAFHLAPVQETGFSKSYYSLKNHLELSGDTFQGTSEQKYAQLAGILRETRARGITFFVDIVLNHCSFDAEWIQEHPDAVYTPQNTPHLRPAFEIDDIIYRWGEEIKSLFQGANQTGDSISFDEEFVKQIEENLRVAFYKLKLEEYFVLSDTVADDLQAMVPPRKPSQNLFAKDPIDIISEFIEANIEGQCSGRHQVTLKNYDVWKSLNPAYEISDMRMAIQSYNNQWTHRIRNEWVPEILRNVMSEVRNDYLYNNYRELTDGYPFVKRYFSRIENKKGGKLFYALNNGWIAGADSSENFALSQQFYYLRRRVNVWGDLIRIRYGQIPSDSPYAWDYMKRYVRKMASLFDGFRLDNCHGTQLNVARYMVKEARLENPDIIIFAELFTDTEEEKALFVRSIGINSTLKEAQHMLSGSAAISSLHNTLGKGARYTGGLNRYMEELDLTVKYSTRKKPITLIYDMTHDNLPYCKQQKQILQTPVTVLISLMGAFIGSTKGYDQFYAEKIEVTETQSLYARDTKVLPIQDKSEVQVVKLVFPAKESSLKVQVVGSWDGWKYKTHMDYCEKSSVFWAELELPPGEYQYKYFSNHSNDEQWLTHPQKPLGENGNHSFTLENGENAHRQIDANLEPLRVQIAKLADKHFCLGEYYAFHINDIVVIVRQGEDHEQSICVVANLSQEDQRLPANQMIELPGLIENCYVWRQTDYSVYEGHHYSCEIIHSRNIREYFDIFYSQEKGKDLLCMNHLPPGFACVVECRKASHHIAAIREIKSLVDSPIKFPQDLDVLDCNLMMYGCSREEEAVYGSSNYVLPQNNNRQLVYGGFAGIFTLIKNAKKDNNLSTDLFDNLRAGNWLLDYYLSRLDRSAKLQEVADRVRKVFDVLKALPRYLIPRYFSDYVYRFCHAIEDHMSQNSHSILERKLKTASAQFISRFPNERPGFEVLVAAGLPHFSTGWARCWGRDTFTCNELLLQFPRIYKQTILQFASSMRHGMIPNLLDSGNNPRYNCRDACWWFIRGVCEYARTTKDYSILKEKVDMMFLSDDLIEHHQLRKSGRSRTLTLEEIIHQIVQTHADGISFREWRAGYEIDTNMTTDGFNILLKVDEDTGVIDGGNPHNCLTWMDKMGSSYTADNKGIPATSRAGQPVELAGLLKVSLDGLIRLHSQGHYAYSKVSFKKREIPYQEWSDKIRDNFEKNFYVPENVEEMVEILQQTDSQADPSEIRQESESYLSSSRIRLKGIYKDVCKAKVAAEEFRLRPNALITLALCPEMINPEHARSYLRLVEIYLLTRKSIGVATLAPIHESLYLPYYDNSDDSSDIKSAHGFSYHNGPEWVWLYGFYVKAKVTYDSENTTKSQMRGLLQEHCNYINNDEWCSLSQMTNQNGQYNHFSCPAQAWSISSLLLAQEAIQSMH